MVLENRPPIVPQVSLRMINVSFTMYVQNEDTY
jgi:hypothetical protein